MLKRLLAKQKEALDHFFAKIAIAQCEKVFEAMHQCQGTIFITGVGKSGYVAQKMAATLLSTGSKAFYLPPLDAMHGDLGMLASQDILLLFSKSGETEELLQLLPAVRNKGVFVIALTSAPTSRLAKASDLFLTLPCVHELCPFDLAPTTSTEIQLLMSDVLAVALMEAKGFTRDAFADNHPAGQLGRRATLKVKDLMIDASKAPFCLSSHRLEEVLVDFSAKRCGCLVVIDENYHLKGIFTDGDLRRALQSKGDRVLKESLQALMTPAPKAISQEALAWEALRLMEENQKAPVTVLPVQEGEKVIGLIKMHDILQAGL